MEKIYCKYFGLFIVCLLFVSGVFAQATQTYNSSTTWNCPNGITSITVQCWAAGGAGGGNSTNADGGGGGGGGAYSEKVVSGLSPISYAVTVGTGGTGVTSGTGNSGGDSWFGSVATVLAKGGTGGFAPAGGNGGVGGTGGAAASGVGTIKNSGGNGGTGRNSNTGQGGPGGSSAGTAVGANGWSGLAIWSTITATAGPAGSGIGGDGGASGGNGNNGTSPGGAGGGSGDNTGSNRIGGNGANGRVILIYPSISSFTPTFACVGSATVVTITGTNFTSATSVKFNGVTATFTVVNSTTITTTLPAGATTGALSVFIAPNTAYSLSNFTVSPIPTPTITPNYCTGGGFVSLQATLGYSAYIWNTGATTSLVSVNQAGNYSVTVTSAAGCTGATSISIGNELVVNGNFSAGNTGFTTAYTYAADIAGQTELYPEGYYGVGPSANNYHDLLYGTDHTTGTGNYMIVNGDPVTGSTIWSQTTSVTPNTTYYFSAWGLSIYNANNAVLQFNVNGLQVGTVAYLPNGYVATSGPYTWVKFYGSWNSGPATSATISIVDLQTILGGNDFGLDDISFGTLSPISLAVSPDANGNDGTCIGNPLVLNSNGAGGASPFTYLWSGPSGYTSSIANPTVTASASAVNNGTYSITVTDGFGCTVSSSISVTINPLPTISLTTTAVPASICSGNSTNINIASSQIGVIYQLRTGITNIGIPVAGTGGTISLPTGVLNANTTFNVLASNATSDCNVQLTTTPTVTVNQTPVLVITNQTICTGTVDLTLPAVTAGSTGGGTLSYWTNAGATISLTSPPPTAVNVNGTYYIKTTTGAGCVDIQPVVVNIGAVPAGAAFTYPTTPFCSTEADPLPSLTGGAFPDVFSSTAGLVFVSTSTGKIDLSASTGGTYTVTLTMAVGGTCTPATTTRTTSVTITTSPIATFSYSSGALCQSVNAIDPSPVFTGGASAGTFTSSSGLLSIAANGLIDISASTPGNYAVVNTINATGGCLAVADTEFIDINPYTFTGALTASSSVPAICLGQSLNLYSAATSYLTVLERENFNGAFNSWSVTDNAGSPASATWTLRPNGYNTGSVTINSNDNTQFYLSNSQVAGNTSTYLQSPIMSTVGFSTLSLEFYNYFDARNSGDNIKVDVSTNGSTWVNVYSYGPSNTDIGVSNGFVANNISLNSYIGQPTFYVRFLFTATNDRVWAIDNVTISGTSTNYLYNWTSSPAGFTSTNDNPTGVSPVVNTFYVISVTNGYGCSNTTSPVPVTVNPNPTAVAGTNSSVCSGSGITIGNGGTVGNTYSWSPTIGLSSSTASNPIASPIVNSTYTLTETVTSSGCSASNSVIVIVNPSGQWLGTVSSDWNNPLNWCGGVPTATTDVLIPTGALSFEPSIFNAPVATCHNLVIQAGHTLTIAAGGDLKLYGALTIGGTYTHTGGVLELVGTAAQTLPAITAFNLIINNTSGGGVTLNGNLTVNGNLTIDASYLDVTPVIKTLSISGNITLQNGGTFNDNCLDYLNITTNSATSNQTFTGNSQLIKCLNLTSIKTAGSLVFAGVAGNTNAYITGDLLINNTGAATITDNGNTLTIGDDVQLGSATSTSANFNFTGTLIFDCSSASTDVHLSDFAGTGITVAILNNLTVNPDVAAPITTVQIYPLISTGQTVFFNGNLSILNTNALNPILNSNSNVISLKGNWTNYASTGFNEGTGQVSFAGTAAVQNIFAAEIFYKLAINNANGVSLNNFILVSNQLILTNGRLITGVNEVQVTSNLVGAITGFSNSSWVHGNLRRTVASTGTYNFPVGDASNIQLATVQLNSSTGINSILGFFNTTITGTTPTYPAVTINGSGIYGLLNSGFWTITPDAYTSVNYDITLNQRGYSNFTGNANQLGIIKRPNSASLWSGTNLANSNGHHDNATQSIAGGTATAKRTAVTAFSDFAEGFGGAPLPVELTTFTAKAVDNIKVDLFWNTQAELNCKYFSVERSDDGITFSEIGIVNGNGTSQIAHDYNFVDENPLCSVAYYRLKQVDENGEIHFTPIASAIINCSGSVSIYPNPTTDQLIVDLSLMKANNSTIKITGLDGKIYLEKQSANSLLKLDVSKLSAGFYFVNIENGIENLNFNFIKQ